MVERSIGQNFSSEIAAKPQGAFEIVAPGAAPEIIALLRLAEREGAYARLSDKRRKTLQMRYVDGLSHAQIAEEFGISKQAVSQTLKLTPESLYRQMTRDVNTYRTPISFREILATYSAYRIYLDKKKKGGE